MPRVGTALMMKCCHAVAKADIERGDRDRLTGCWPTSLVRVQAQNALALYSYSSQHGPALLGISNHATVAEANGKIILRSALNGCCMPRMAVACYMWGAQEGTLALGAPPATQRTPARVRSRSKAPDKLWIKTNAFDGVVFASRFSPLPAWPRHCAVQKRCDIGRRGARGALHAVTISNATARGDRVPFQIPVCEN